jgi:3'-phosphoadenosine 5'-phosphosulfate sulfotransferase (PAPS reductase)/FAD synthetase
METYPKRVLSLGAGVQSTTLLLMMVEGEIEKPDHIIFADTGWEPAKVYEHLEWLKTIMARADIPFEIVSHGNIREDYLDGTKRAASMPLYIRHDDGTKGLVRRQCTSEYKLKPLMAKQRELAGLKAGQRCKEHRITTVLGISLDEVQRMRDPKFSWIKHDYPLIDLRMTRQDCLDWCEERNYPKPPRSACIGCPFKSQEEWRYLKQNENEWNDAVQFDDELRSNQLVAKRFRGDAFLHRQAIPLREVDLRSQSEKGVFSLFDQECEGMCGI